MISKYFRECSVGLAFLGLLLILALAGPSFFQAQPLLSLATREAPTLVVALGMALVIISRQIDISVGSQFAVMSVLAGMGLAKGWSIPAMTAFALLGGGLLGAINGVLVAYLRLPSIVVTLATMVTWREALRLWQQGALVNLPTEAQWFGLSQTAGQASIIGIACIIWIFSMWASRSLAAVRFVYAIGSDAEAARLAGIPARCVAFSVFLLMGVLCGLAAMLNVVQSPQVDPKGGTGLELKVIAACVVGGVAVAGGRGRMMGVFLGLLLLITISPALVHLHVNAYWEKAIHGAIILIAVLADGIRNRRVTHV